MKTKLIPWLLAVSLSLTSCVTTSKKGLESLIESHRKVQLSQESIRNTVKIPFEYFEVSLNLSENRSINLEVYHSQQAFSNIVLLPTLGEPATSLEKFSSEMAGLGHNVYALDIEGFGKSTGKKGKIDLNKIKEDISRTIEYLQKTNSKNIVLAGTSIGSEYSFIYLNEGKYKEEIDAAILHGLYAPYLHVGYKDFRESVLKNPISGLFVNILSAGKLDIWSRLGKKNFYNNIEEFSQVSNDPLYVRKVNTGAYRKFFKHKLDEKPYPGHILFIVSEADRIIDFKRSMNLYEHLKERNSNTLLYFPGSAQEQVPHMVFDTNPKEISEQIDFFLRGRLED